ncbi:MAG: hypothetical protein HUU30_12065 [Burkholderiaceae bacterium]|nr:hypothetical protein [Aquabacterium sp.]NUP86471.1 hypothetical protein [Burkholderiaceae bacterium]
MAEMTEAERARYHAQRQAAIEQQNAHRRQHGEATTPGLSGSKDPNATPWCTVTPGLPGQRFGRRR